MLFGTHLLSCHLKKSHHSALFCPKMEVLIKNLDSKSQEKHIDLDFGSRDQTWLNIPNLTLGGHRWPTQHTQVLQRAFVHYFGFRRNSGDHSLTSAPLGPFCDHHWGERRSFLTLPWCRPEVVERVPDKRDAQPGTQEGPQRGRLLDKVHAHLGEDQQYVWLWLALTPKGMIDTVLRTYICAGANSQRKPFHINMLVPSELLATETHQNIVFMVDSQMWPVQLYPFSSHHLRHLCPCGFHMVCTAFHIRAGGTS